MFSPVFFMHTVYENNLRSFLDYLAFEKRYSSHTLKSYENDLSSFLFFCDKSHETTDIQEIRSFHVKNWLVSLKDSGLSSKSLNRKISCLKTYFKFEMKKGTIEKSPMLNIMSPKVPKKLPQFVENLSLIHI